jgi:hypothetical protein
MKLIMLIVITIMSKNMYTNNYSTVKYVEFYDSKNTLVSIEFITKIGYDKEVFCSFNGNILNIQLIHRTEVLWKIYKIRSVFDSQIENVHDLIRSFNKGSQSQEAFKKVQISDSNWSIERDRLCSHNLKMLKTGFQCLDFDSVNFENLDIVYFDKNRVLRKETFAESKKIGTVYYNFLENREIISMYVNESNREIERYQRFTYANDLYSISSEFLQNGREYYNENEYWKINHQTVSRVNKDGDTLSFAVESSKNHILNLLKERILALTLNYEINLTRLDFSSYEWYRYNGYTHKFHTKKMSDRTVKIMTNQYGDLLGWHSIFEPNGKYADNIQRGSQISYIETSIQ